MVLALGVLGVGGVGFAAYSFGVKPVLAKREQLKTLQGEVEWKQESKEKVQRSNQQRLKEYHARSLPGGEVEFSWREYQLLIERLLDEAKAPPRGYTIQRDAAHASVAGVPLLNPDDKKDKTPAYTKIAYKVEMKRVSLDVVTEFLARYYRSNLLHQITLLEVKRDGQVDLGEDKRPHPERDDLNVTLITEAMILNGAPARKTILAIPPSNGAVLGGASLWAMEQTPSVGRTITPQWFEPILANKPARDYLLVAARDPFHGTLPVPPPPAPPPVKVEQVIPPKPDYGDLIYYTTKYKRYEGAEQSAELCIRDKINNEDYEIFLTQSGERVKVVVKKFYFVGGKKKLADRGDLLEIANSSMRNKHKFTVYGLDDDAIIVGEKPSGLAELVKGAEPPRDDRNGGGGRPGSGPGRGNGPKTPLPPADPKAAVLGGAGAVLAPRAERFYRWEYGQPLNKLVELQGKEAEKAVQRAQSSLFAAAPVDAATATAASER
jgi:hypothetical protein